VNPLKDLVDLLYKLYKLYKLYDRLYPSNFDLFPAILNAYVQKQTKTDEYRQM
jgi:hypothetical protein